ncbi:MAG: CHAD domain-containing protein [Alcanivoracaceae bacterium]|jgi:CHAD domain-containing protein|nr:CHAD domain-containing protein [Alcanivoracaceae bacterium]
MAKQPIERLREHALRVHYDVSMMLDTDGPLEEDAIHGLRVAAKEVRALWQLLKPLLDDLRAEQAIASLGEAAASLSEARDQYVTADTLARLCQRARSKDARAALEDAMHLLQASRPEQSTHAAASKQLRESWVADGKRWETLDISISQAELISEGYGRLYRKAHRLTHSALSNDDIQLWHSLRKWVKYLALTLPLAGDSHKLEDLHSDVSRLGKKLGRLHDLDRLLIELATLEWPDHNNEQLAYVSHLIRREMGSVLDQCGSLSKDLFDEEPRKFIRELRRHSR